MPRTAFNREMRLSGYSGKSAEAVVLPDDLDRVELGVGRRGAVERQIEDRNVEAREPGSKAAVGQVGVTAQHEVDIGGLVPAGYCSASLRFSRFATIVPCE